MHSQIPFQANSLAAQTTANRITFIEIIIAPKCDKIE